jgi:hypothetical protein
MLNKNTQKQGFMQRTGDFVIKSSGWPLMASGGRIIFDSWRQIAERDRPVIPDDSWEKACLRHGVTLGRLAEIKKDLRRLKRTYMVCGAGCLYLAVLAVMMIFTQGFSMAHLSMLVGSIGAATICFSFIFKHTFRIWQCEIRRLDGVGEFFRDAGLARMVRW